MRVNWLENKLVKMLLLAGCAFFVASTALLAQTYPPGPYPQAPQAGYPQAGYPQGVPPQGGVPQGMPQQTPGNGAPTDEPGRAVARFGILNGDASIRRGDSSDWVAAAVNAPLMSGDQISVAAGSRAEIQLDPAHFLRIAGDTELRLADLENGHFQIQISHGVVTWRILRDSQVQPEISTPLVGVHPGRLSVVRVEVSGDGTSHITVRRGEATVVTQKGSEKIAENSTMDVRGSVGDPEFQVVAAAVRDDFDNWSDQRDSYLARAQAPRYVPQGVSGVEDLDAYGHWGYDPAYGWVWMPTVASSWAPYHEGQWVWEDYYGWTWVDSAPWGWAPFHYGSWYSRPGLGWAWYPGPLARHVWWRPAMVGFFGWGPGIGVGVGFGFGNIGWIPLAPFEPFYPWYGRGGFGGGVVLGVGLHAGVAGFRNANVIGGVTAVTAADFGRGNFRNSLAVDRATLQQASVVRGTVPMTPTSQNLHFSNRAATVPAGSGSAQAARFFGSSTASAQRTPFAQQQAAVRSAVTGQGRSQTVGGQGQSSAAGWERFQGNSAQNSSAAGARTATPGGSSAPGFSRFGATPNGSSQSGAQSAQPRQYQVSPSIIRQRSDAAPAATPAPSYGSGTTQARPQQAPAPAAAPAQGSSSGSAAAPRGSAAGGRSTGGHSGHR